LHAYRDRAETTRPAGNWRAVARTTPAQLQNYREMLEGLKRIRRKYHEPFEDPSIKSMLEAIDWVLIQWAGQERILETSYPNS
jgi:hypothetical protein